VKTHDEVLEYAGAFLQLYREEGWYLERTVHYVSRVGLEHCKKKVVEDAANRKALWERLQFALDGEPDPWHDTKGAGVDTRQFIPVAAVQSALATATGSASATAQMTATHSGSHKQQLA
jgi:nitrite reductase (NADH) large subunit